jgi:hypothetical protein
MGAKFMGNWQPAPTAPILAANDSEWAALERLTAYAAGTSDGSRAIADMLLAWWNADTCGRFDPRAVWHCDDDVVEDAIVVFGLIARCRWYPDQPPHDRNFTALLSQWRPEL